MRMEFREVLWRAHTLPSACCLALCLPRGNAHIQLYARYFLLLMLQHDDEGKYACLQVACLHFGLLSRSPGFGSSAHGCQLMIRLRGH